MKAALRPRVASIVAADYTGNEIDSIFDCDRSQYVSLSAKIENGEVDGFDYSTATYFSGNGKGTLDFFDYQSSSYVDLKKENGNYSGFDYETASYFDAKISGSTVEIFDYQTSKYYNFSF